MEDPPPKGEVAGSIPARGAIIVRLKRVLMKFVSLSSVIWD